ncbi:MAG: hypothetical protein LBL46_00665 [Rickettsiales bacterium]|jgi:hypothetical protein|nr:hypothetical protein [Rickettsiales bacterium]
MSFQNKNLSVIAYANGFTMWHYAGTDALATISAKGYFDSVAGLMNTGDIVVVNGGDTTGLRKITATSPAVSAAAV